jgi:hypothetical protein
MDKEPKKSKFRQLRKKVQGGKTVNLEPTLSTMKSMPSTAAYDTTKPGNENVKVQ